MLARHGITLGAMGMLVALVAATAVAQAQNAGDEAAGAQQDAAAAPAQATPAQPAPPPAPPPPGPEVMRPNEHGFRMTPALARAIGKAGAHNMSRGMKFTPEQQQQVGDVITRRVMESARNHQNELGDGIEHMLETLLPHMPHGPDKMQLTPEQAKEAAERCGPILSVSREVMQGVQKDIEPILDPEQKKVLDKEMKEGYEGMDRVDAMLNRWSQGGYQPGDNPFDDNPKKQEAGAQDGSQQNAPPEEPIKAEMRQAQATADWHLQYLLGPPEWERLSRVVQRYFKFSTEQEARAKQLLKDYRAKADEIMNAEWKQQLRENRVKSALSQRYVRGQPSRPFIFRLQMQYNALIQPVNDLGQAFRTELLDIVTPEQRAVAAGELQGIATAVGIPLQPTDETLLGLPAASQPVAAGAQ